MAAERDRAAIEALMLKPICTFYRKIRREVCQKAKEK